MRGKVEETKNPEKAMTTIVNLFTVDGGWSPWTPWTPCSFSSCPEVPNSNRTRACDNPPRLGLGQDCQGDSTEWQPCPACPEWEQWEPWSSCSVTCGDGSRQRNRSMTDGSGVGMEGEACNLGECPGKLGDLNMLGPVWQDRSKLAYNFQTIKKINLDLFFAWNFNLVGHCHKS